MIANAFQSIGIVITIVVLILITVITMYVSWILAIAVFLGGLGFVVYHLLSMFKSVK